MIYPAPYLYPGSNIFPAMPPLVRSDAILDPGLHDVVFTDPGTVALVAALDVSVTVDGLTTDAVVGSGLTDAAVDEFATTVSITPPARVNADIDAYGGRATFTMSGTTAEITGVGTDAHVDTGDTAVFVGSSETFAVIDSPDTLAVVTPPDLTDGGVFYG